VWARDPELAREIYERDANSRYLPGFALPSHLKATADLEKAVHDIDPAGGRRAHARVPGHPGRGPPAPAAV